MNGGQIQL